MSECSSHKLLNIEETAVCRKGGGSKRGRGGWGRGEGGGGGNELLRSVGRQLQGIWREIC